MSFDGPLSGGRIIPDSDSAVSSIAMAEREGLASFEDHPRYPRRMAVPAPWSLPGYGVVLAAAAQTTYAYASLGTIPPLVDAAILLAMATLPAQRGVSSNFGVPECQRPSRTKSSWPSLRQDRHTYLRSHKPSSRKYSLPALPARTNQCGNPGAMVRWWCSIAHARTGQDLRWE